MYINDISGYKYLVMVCQTNIYYRVDSYLKDLTGTILATFTFSGSSSPQSSTVIRQVDISSISVSSVKIEFRVTRVASGGNILYYLRSAYLCNELPNTLVVP